VFHSSRSFRNSLDAKIAKRQLREAGVVLVFTQQNLISGDPNRKIEEGLLEMMDEHRSDEQSMFVTSGLRQKFERVLHNGTVPLGYQRLWAAPGDSTNGELLIVQRETDTVRRIYEVHQTGQYSDLQIAIAVNAETNAAGEPLHRTKQGKPFTEGGIREILTNRVYTGMVVWHPRTPEEETRPGRHEAIIQQDLFDEVQAIRAGRAHWTGRRSVARVYLLSTRARCFDCGARVVGDTGGRRNRRRMRHSRTGLCAGWRSHHAHILETQLCEFMTARVVLSDEWQTDVKKLLAQPTVAPSDNAQRRSAVERAMERIRSQHKWGDLTDEQYQVERQELQRALDEIPRDQTSPFALTDYGRAAKLLSEFGTLWNHPGVSAESRKALIEEVFEQVQIDGLGIRAVKPAEEYLPLMAIATWGDTAREIPVSRSRFREYGKSLPHGGLFRSGISERLLPDPGALRFYFLPLRRTVSVPVVAGDAPPPVVGRTVLSEYLDHPARLSVSHCDAPSLVGQAIPDYGDRREPPRQALCQARLNSALAPRICLPGKQVRCRGQRGQFLLIR